MPHRMKEQDFIDLKRYIEAQKKPLFFENEFGKFALVLTENGKKRFLNEGFIAITLNELRNWIKDCKSFRQQQRTVLEKTKALAEGYRLAKETAKVFEGKIIDLRG